MASDNKKSILIIIGGGVVIGLLIISGLTMGLPTLGGRVSLQATELVKSLEIENFPTEKLIQIIEDYGKCKNDFEKRLKGPSVNSARNIIATRDDSEAIAMQRKFIMGTYGPDRQESIYIAGKSRNKASVSILCDALKRHISLHEDNLIVDALIKIDDPFALECFIEESSKLPRAKSPTAMDASGDKADRAIKRWQDMKSGKIKQAVPFDVDRTFLTTSRNLLEVNSFGGYKFTIDNKWKRTMEQRLNDTTDQFDLARYYRTFLGLFNGYIELKLKVTELSADKAVALEKTIAKQSSLFKNLPTINGNPYMVSVSEAEGGHYFAYAVMKVGNLEVSAEMKSESHYWFMCNANEIIAIFKSFTRGLAPNKKFSIFY